MNLYLFQNKKENSFAPNNLDLKGIRQNKENNLKRPHIVWSHVYKIFKIKKKTDGAQITHFQRLNVKWEESGACDFEEVA